MFGFQRVALIAAAGIRRARCAWIAHRETGIQSVHCTMLSGMVAKATELGLSPPCRRVTAVVVAGKDEMGRLDVQHSPFREVLGLQATATDRRRDEQAAREPMTRSFPAIAAWIFPQREPLEDARRRLRITARPADRVRAETR